MRCPQQIPVRFGKGLARIWKVHEMFFVGEKDCEEDVVLKNRKRIETKRASSSVAVIAFKRTYIAVGSRGDCNATIDSNMTEGFLIVWRDTQTDALVRGS